MEDDKGRLMEELRSKLKDIEPLPGEEDFFTSNETLMRYLKARDWKVKDAEKLLRATIQWRRKMNPLRADCTGCHEKPGMHPIRQVGFDEMGRPVIYFCFAQASVTKNTIEQTITHSMYLIENAKKTMRPGVTTWVMIMDCRGITLPACNPRLGYQATQTLSNHYPERLGLVICLNHNAVFQGVWKAMKVVLHPNTIAKMKLVRSKKKVKELFERLFPDELTKWLLDEIKLNKQSPLAASQREFWRPPPYKEAHDPRGCPSYVRDYIDTYLSRADEPVVHKPHPNIIDYLQGNMNVLSVATSSTSLTPDASKKAASQANNCTHDDEDNSDEDESESLDDDVSIDEEFQIPKDATPIQINRCLDKE